MTKLRLEQSMLEILDKKGLPTKQYVYELKKILLIQQGYIDKILEQNRRLEVEANNLRRTENTTKPKNIFEVIDRKYKNN